MKKDKAPLLPEDLEKYKTRNTGSFHHTFIMKVLKDLSMEGDNIAQFEKKYGIGRATLWYWRAKFKEEYDLYQLLAAMNKKKQLTKQELIAENERLQQALEQALLKNRALETLIDVAEEELNIQVRKKSGPKQSKE